LNGKYIIYVLNYFRKPYQFLVVETRYMRVYFVLNND